MSDNMVDLISRGVYFHYNLMKSGEDFEYGKQLTKK